jgi:hypothetical protein
MSTFFELGVENALAKVASNPAAPQKSSKGGMESSSPSTAYLNQGGGKAQAQSAGAVQSHSPAYPGYINVGNKAPPEQSAGDVGGRAGSPDTGELGSPFGSGDQNVQTKSASWLIGMDDSISAVIDDDA